MTPFDRKLKQRIALTLAAAFALPSVALLPTATAQDAATAPAAAPMTAAPMAAAPDKALKDSVDNYWYYGKVARYELASQQAQKIADSGAPPEEVLKAFEAVTAARGDNLDQWLIRWQGIDAMKPTTSKITQIIEQGYAARRSSPDFLTTQIDRLATNERAYGLAITRIRESGELAVPFILNRLHSGTKPGEQPVLRRALRDLGRIGLNPLVAATEMKDWATLSVVLGVLGDLGYPATAPYIARVLELPDAPASVKSVAIDALGKLGVTASSGTKASDLFYDLAEKIYDGSSSITDDSRFPTSNVWYFGNNGLERKEVPHEIWHDLMTMRTAEYTLKLGGPRSDEALSLWLTANYKREADLPKDVKDATRPDNYPSSDFWGVSAGAKYLNAALARAVKDRNAQVAFKAVKSLQEIVGNSSLGAAENTPLINATQFPDRKVRFEAAFALAEALPEKNYEGSSRVVPLLAEALSQSGQPSVLVVAPSQDDVNKLVDGLKKAGYAAVGATGPDGAASAAIALPACDALVVSEDLDKGKVDQLFLAASQNPKLAGAARLIMTHSNTGSIYEARKATDSLLSTTAAMDADGLKPAIEAARAKAGALPIDPAVATDYSTRAANLLVKIGTNRSVVYPLAPAKAALLSGLSDSRTDIVKLTGQALALLDDKDVQLALLNSATDEKTADDVKISLYKSLAASAKNFGDTLSPEQAKGLEKVVAEATNLEVRSAAAEARGALNLPADQAKSLVVSQSKV